jgi:hypothetical protein
MPIGEIRESNHINCLHWNYNILLTAWREGSLWRIWKSDTGETLLNMANLEFAWWNDDDKLVKEVKASWSGDDFSLTLSNNVPFGGSHILNYLGDAPRGGLWKCYWHPQKKLFVHTLAAARAPRAATPPTRHR